MPETVGALLHSVMKQVLQTFQTLISTFHNPWPMLTSQDYLSSWGLRGSQVVGCAPGVLYAQLLSTFLNLEHLQEVKADMGKG